MRKFLRRGTEASHHPLVVLRSLSAPDLGASAAFADLVDLEERFACTVCGHRGADVRPWFETARVGG